MTAKEIFRKVIKVYTSSLTREGAGFPVYRPFPSNSIRHIDPFLLLDEMGPVEYGPNEAKGAPPHPHKGFETLTYLIDGEFEHKDSIGNRRILQSDSAQWLTIGSGIIHSEMPTNAFLNSGGRLHAIQLWVNLLKKDKILNPWYQQLKSIPHTKTPDGSSLVKVIVGSSNGITSPLLTRTPMTILHIKTAPSYSFTQSIPSGFNVLVYVLSGHGKFGPPYEGLGALCHQMVLFQPLPGIVRVENGSVREDLNYLIIAGAPLNEKVVQQGYFVMNSKEEIEKAWEDFYNKKFGDID